jgi:thiol-disulfide isomerase/thioredoxin
MTASTTQRRRAGPGATPQARRPPVVAIALGALAVVTVLGVIVAMVRSGDDEPTARTDALVYGSVTTTGSPLPELTTSTDTSVGTPAPVLEGQTLDGSAISVGGPGEPTVVAFLAHWCPHCQAELPRLVALADADGFEGVRVVVVLTGTDADAPNLPPAAWLEDEGWTGDVLVDDEEFTAASAYGLGNYPYLVAVDADGNVAARTSGEHSTDELTAFADLARRG